MSYSIPKHDVHKFRDHVKLTETNWVDWSVVAELSLAERGLWRITNGSEPRPTPIVDDSERQLLIDAWDEKDQHARAQIIPNLSVEVRTKVRGKVTAAAIWSRLVSEFQSTDPEAINAVRMQYDTLWLPEGSPISTHLDKLHELRDRLTAMGDTISDVSHASRLLRNLGDDWESVASNIRTLTSDPVVVSLKLRTEETYREGKRMRLEGFERERASALVAHRFGQSKSTAPSSTSTSTSKSPSFLPCTNPNCDVRRRRSHPIEKCWAKGGGAEGKGPTSTTASKQSNGAGATHTKSGNDSAPRSNESKSAADIKAVNAVWTTIRAPVTESSEPILNSIPTSLYTARPNSWALDSGCTSHITMNKDWLFDYREIEPIRFLSANKEGYFNAIGKGKVNVAFLDRTSREVLFRVTLTDVLYSPEIGANLMSVAQLDTHGVNVAFYDGKVDLSVDNSIIGHGTRLGDLYWIVAECQEQFIPLCPPTSNLAHGEASSTADITTWHHRLGHLNYSSLQKMIRQAIVDGISITRDKSLPSVCAGCMHGKQQRAPFPASEFVATKVLELVSSDLMGPFPKSLGGSSYAVTWIDAFSGYTKIDFLKNKDADSVLDSFTRFHVESERQTGKKLEMISTDNGGEYDNAKFKAYCKKFGIRHFTTAPYTPQQNGRAERMNRVLQEAELAMRGTAKLGTGLWAESMSTASYIRNRVPSSRKPLATPFELYWGIKPNLAHARTFGCKVHVMIPDAMRRKGSPKSVEGKFIGYFENSKAFKVWVPSQHRIVKSRDVVFDEGGIIERVAFIPPDKSAKDLGEGELSFWDIPPESLDPPAPIPASDDSPPPISNSNPDLPPLSPLTDLDDLPPLIDVDDSDNENEDDPPPAGVHATDPHDVHDWERSDNTQYGRGMRRTADFAHTAFAVLDDDEPANYREAVTGPLRDEWRKAMKIELDQLIATNAWSYVDLPPGRKAMGCTWVYRIKRDANGNIIKYKARLVAQGFSQIPGVDYHPDTVFANTPRTDTNRTVFALATEFDLDLRHFDIKGAFLQGDLKEEVYMRQPQGFVRPGFEDKVCGLNKSLYGLKQASHVWQDTLREWLTSLGFTPINADSTCYTKIIDGRTIMVAWHVDDGILAAPKDLMQQVIDLLVNSERFEVTDLGEPTKLLGCIIDRDRTAGTLKLSVPQYIDTLVSRVDLSDAYPVGSPLDPSVVLQARSAEDGADPEMADKPYLAVLGTIGWIVETCRPDVAFARSKLCQFMSNPSVAHWDALMRVVRYLKGTAHLGVTFRRGVNTGITCYTDADWASDTNDRASFSGYVVMFNGSPLSWSCRKQHTVATSSMESEYLAAMAGTTHAIWIRRLLHDFKDGLDVARFIKNPTTLYLDNQAAESFIKNDVNFDRTKHIDTKYHFVRRSVELGEISIAHIAGSINPADILTKSLSPAQHRRALQLLGMLA